MLKGLQLKAEEERKKRLMKLESKYNDSKPGSSSSLVSSPSLEGEEARKSLQVIYSYRSSMIQFISFPFHVVRNSDDDIYSLAESLAAGESIVRGREAALRGREGQVRGRETSLRGGAASFPGYGLSYSFLSLSCIATEEKKKWEDEKGTTSSRTTIRSEADA